MSRKQSTDKKTDKKPDKKNFFGDHLEIKPTFMQRPKSMEEVMAEAFSRPSTVEDKTIVEHKPTVENKTIVDHKPTVENKTTVEQQTTVELSAKDQTLEGYYIAADVPSTVENKTIVDHKPTVENKTTVVNHATIENKATADYTPTAKATVDTYAMVENDTTVVATTVEDKSIDKTDKQDKPLKQGDKESKAFVLSELATQSTLLTTVANSTVVDNATVAKKTTIAEIPSRLRADVSLLKRVVDVKWQAFPQIEVVAKDTPTYWQAYTKAWHWIEDEIVPYLDKDSKLTLRKCYRKAFGDISAKGKFFAGQTLLAQEVGLSKRRIQDILEIFNLLGWVRKIAHHNRGGYKGTDYEMYLPSKAIDYFLEN